MHDHGADTDERFPCGPQFMPWEMSIVESWDPPSVEPLPFLRHMAHRDERSMALAFKPIMDEGSAFAY